VRSSSRFSFFLGLVSVVLAAVLSSPLRGDQRLRIVAANLTSGNGQNYDPGHGNRILQGLSPDVVLVQEFNYLNNTSADFRAWVDMNFGASFFYVREPNPSQIPNGVVSRYPILASGAWNDANVSNRDFMWARIDIPGDKDLWVISVHLLTTSSSNRNAEAVQILNYIAAQGIPAADYVALGGDFNTDSRSESCLNTLSAYFTTSGPWPVDQSGNGNTNSGRNKPYDWVLADPDLHAVRTPLVLGAASFPNGLVFDSRVYSPLPSPVLAGDSAATNMQHMAVARDFLIPSSTGPASPSIYSATSASAVAGQSFTYQIAATNAPASYGASGLPAGLSVNPTSGLISGTPAAAGNASITLSATNAAGTGNATLVLTVNAASGGGGGGGSGGTLFSENMGTPTSNTPILTYATGTAPATFQNKGSLSFGQGEQTNQGDVRSTLPSTGYTDASGGGNVWLTSTSGAYGFSIESINASSHANLSLAYGYYKNATSGHVALSVDYWSGTAWVTLANTASVLFNESASAAQGWYLAKPLALPVAAQINGLKIRFVKTGSLAVRIDDVKLTGTPVATPTITAGGTLAAVDTVYGVASPVPATMTVAGSSLAAGILVTAPAGFEISRPAGGATGYAATQTLTATAGTVATTTVHLRLAAETGVGSYVGNVVCSSAGAASVSLPVAPSAVALRPLLITALDRTKAFGTVFNAGTSAFTAEGLVPGQTIGAVTLTAVGGAGIYDAAGTYSVVPSQAVGGTFLAANYSISYGPGTLSVTAPTFAEWAAGLADGSALGDSDGDGVVNLLEYFFGLDPVLSDAFSPGVQAVIAGAELSFDYRRNKAAVGVTGTVETATELASGTLWTADDVVADEMVQDFDTYETRRATVTVNPGETRKFVRLRVTQP
jgi:endonuclease/exonuclease/phosphatase family metal-dependent hydrolase